MAQDLWEGSELLIKVKVAGEATKPYTGTVDLLYIKNGQDDKPLATQTGLALSNGELEHKYTLPDVGPDEANYAIKVIAAHGTDKATRSDVAEAVVWPKTLTIHCRTDVRPNEAKVPLVVVQEEVEVAQPVTGDDGKCTATLARKAPYSLKTLAPYSIVSEQTEPAKRREHKLTVQRNIVAMFAKPDLTQADYIPNDGSAPDAKRQYVNLVTGAQGQDAKGNEVLFEVCANPKAEGRTGDRIYLQVTFGRESKRNKPQPKLMGSPAVSELHNGDSDPVHTGWVALGSDGGSATFKVDLGLAGGDTCAVAIGGRKDEFTDASIALVNWRKLFYQLRFPAMMAARLSASKDLPDDLRDFVKARLGAAFIEYEMTHAIEFPDGDATVAKGNGSFFPSAYLKDNSGGNTYIVSDGILSTNGKFTADAARKSRSIYISLCERAFSSNPTARTMAPLVESASFEIASPGGYLFEPSTSTGAANLKVSNYRWQADVTQPHETLTVVNFTAAGVGAAAGHTKLVETTRVGQSLDVSFAAKPGGHEVTLSATEKGKVEAFVASLLNDKPALRKAGNKLSLALSTDTGDAAGLARAAAVQAAAQAKFDALAVKVSMHPGLDDNGAPRSGPMNLAWLSFKDYSTILVSLPTSPSGTADHLKVLPGDFVGASETATQCKVKVKFDFETAGSINGNSGGGEQILVLRSVSAAAASSTICHELGHSMGMTIVPGLANDLAPPNLTAKHIDNGGTSYVNGDAPYALNDGKRSIHKGGHCAFNVTTKASANFAGWSPSLATVGCIMWGAGGSTDSRPAFCPTCLDLLKARRLEDIRRAFAGRGADQG